MKGSARSLNAGPALALCVACGLLLAQTAAAGPAPTASTALRSRVQAALSSSGKSGENAYARSVWLKTMSARLAPYVSNPGKRRKLLGLVRTEADRAGVPPSLVLAMINVESDFKPWAVSAVGAQGLMQIMPFWLKVAGKPGDNLFNPRTNVRIGCTVLAYYMKRSHGDIAEALQRYYGKRFGTRYTTRVLKLLETRWYWK